MVLFLAMVQPVDLSGETSNAVGNITLLSLAVKLYSKHINDLAESQSWPYGFRVIEGKSNALLASTFITICQSIMIFYDNS